MPLFNPSSGGSVSPGSITNTEVSASAAIAATKIHDGSVDNTEFGYLNGVTSAIQTQLNSAGSTSLLSAVSGWTDTAGSGSASHPSFVATLAQSAIQSGLYEPSDFTGPRVTVPLFTEFPASAIVYTRLATIVGDNTVHAYFGLVSEGDNRFLGMRVRADNGQLNIRSGGSTVYTPGNIPTDGTGWIAYQRSAGSCSFYYGTGTSTTPPATWTPAWTLTDVGATTDTTVVFALSKAIGAVVASATFDLAVVRKL